ncbi:hypothetical protein PPL_11879 [Heterostelium album PN500]|uniref:EGF-like domain-containing protein n=1 Tax=Heterostelium pallidum (strain ATCC 26659 / Pp 5 / PN500) TaxID=670386 RepID=D3BUQ8_HETP5|nr:hypothetical protein PPL_11879 [Heterostelium album PN500]EFA74846.1 hypothetical protein PPL_11879 [Heterostelium album PN500]|eukprot:XP_020426980.1 hypothetical protein PPL_11879 [Heterostelium album PN500]
MEKRRFLFVFLFSILIPFVKCQTPIKYNLNNHSYQSFSNALNFQDAQTFCSNQIYNETKGYLATITFQEELAYLISKGVMVSGQSYWIGTKLGTSKIGHPLWSYSNGPEKNLNVYNVLTDQCFTYCIWQDPIFDPTLSGLSVQVSTTPKYFPQNPSTALNFVCEWGGDNDPYVTLLSRSENKIIINNLPPSIIPSMKVYSVCNTDSSINFSCNSFVSITNTSAYCMISSFRPGLYSIKITSGSTVFNIVSMVEPPWVTSIDIAIDQGTDQYLMTGKNINIDTNFGLDLSFNLASIPAGLNCWPKGGTKYTLSCTINIQTQNLGKAYPLSVTAGGVTTKFYRTPMINGTDTFFYSVIKTNVTYEDAQNLASMIHMEGLQGQLGVIPTQKVLNSINKDFSSFTGVKFDMWQSVNYSTATSEFENLVGPNIGKPQTVFYNNTLSTAGVTGNSRFYLDNLGAIHTSNNDIQANNYSGIYIMYGQSNIFTVTPLSQLYLIPTSGTIIQVVLNNIGTANNQDTVNITSNGVVLPNSIDILHSTATITLPAGVGGNSAVPITFKNTKKTSGNIDLRYQYNKPIIVSWSPLQQPTSGGLTQFDGTDFFPDKTQLTFEFGMSTLTIVNSTYTRMFANIPVGVGKVWTNLFVGTQIFTFLYTYQNPTISNTEKNSTVIDVYGTNFGIFPSSIRILTEGGEHIPVVFNTVDHTHIQFQVPPAFRNGNYSVEVGGQLSNTFGVQFIPSITFVNSPPVTGGAITIEGWNFAQLDTNNQSTSPKLYLNGNQLNSFTYIQTPNATGQSYLIEYTIPAGTGYLSLSAIVDNLSSNVYNFSYQYPTVIEANSIYKEIGGDVSITGSNFATTNLIVGIGGINCATVQYINSTNLICKNFGDGAALNNNGIAYVNVTVDSLEGGAYLFTYLTSTNTSQPCNHQCSNGGTCNNATGFCVCTAQWEGLDCLTPKKNNTTPPIPDGNGGTIIVGGGLNFTIAITHLREIDPTFTSIKTLPMTNIKWYKRQNTSSSYLFAGEFDGETVTVSLNMTIYYQRQNVEFAGEIIEMADNSMNRIVKSSVVALSKDDPLYQEQQQNNTSSSSDSKQQFLYMTAIQTSPFRNSVIIDPNFSSLISPTTKSNCSSDEKWKLIVIIVCSVVGGIFAVALIVLYARHRILRQQLQRRLSSYSSSTSDKL